MLTTSVTHGTPWVVVELLKATVWLLAAFGAAVSLRRASAGARHLVWSLGIVGALLLPVVSLALPWRARVLPAPLAGSAALVGEVSAPSVGQLQADVPTLHGQAAAAVEPESEQSGAGAESVTLDGDANAHASVSPWAATARRALGWPWPSVLLGLWLAGAFVVVGRLALGWWLLNRVVSRSEGPEGKWLDVLGVEARRMGLRRLPRLALSRTAPMPFACGVARPTIVLPDDALQWSEARVRAVLLHELAHLRRRDIQVNFLARLACGLYWFHPLVWAAARRVRSESERACDDLVLGAGTRASDYARHLLEIMRRVRRSRTPALAVPMARRGEMEGRMLAILEPASRRGAPSRWQSGLALAGVAILVVPLAALAPARNGEAPGENTSSAAMYEAPQVHRGSNQESAAPPVSAAPHPQRPRQQQGPDVVGALLALLDDSVAQVRLEAVYALARRDDPRIAGPVAQRLARDGDASVREMAAWALSQIGAKDFAGVLANAVRNDNDADVRATAAWALGHFRDPATAPALAAALSDRHADVRQAAAWGLGQIRPAHAPDALRKALTDADADVRQAAAWAIGQGRDATAAPDLVTALDDRDPEVRKAAIWALGRMDGVDAQAVLIKALDSNDPDVRAAAARALSGHTIDPWPWPWPRPRIR